MVLMLTRTDQQTQDQTIYVLVMGRGMVVGVGSECENILRAPAIRCFRSAHERAKAKGWRTPSVNCRHDVMLDLPGELTNLLLETSDACGAKSTLRGE